MNNILSYCGLVDSEIRASDKDLPVQKKQKETLAFQMKQERLLEGKLIEAQRKEVLQEEKETEKKEMLEKIKFKHRWFSFTRFDYMSFKVT